MPEPVLSAEQYSELVRERLAGLRGVLADLTRDAPQSAPRRFSESIQILIDTIENLFADRKRVVKERSTSAAEVTDGIVFAARWSMYLLNNVQQQYFPFLEKLNSPHVPLPIQPTLQRIGTQFEPTVELYLFPTSEHNYGFSGFRNVVEAFIQEFRLVIPDDLMLAIQERAEKLPRWFVFLSLPYVVHDSALNLTPLLHELGHFVDFDREIYKKVLPIDIAHSEAAKTLANILVQRGSPEQEVYALCKEIVRKWVQELIADLFAIRLAGPAYFYAFVIYAANIGLDTKAAVSHPSPVIRIDLMLRELEELGYFLKSSPKAIRTSLQEWKRWIRAQKLEPEDTSMHIAFLAIKDNSAKIAQFVRKYASPLPYRTQTYKENVPGLIADLEKGIPPIDQLDAQGTRFIPSDLADILNSAWSAYMFSLDKLEDLIECKAEDKRRIAVRTLNELVLKAIEASEILWKCQASPGEEAWPSSPE